MPSDLALEVDHLTKTFRLHQDKANSIKALIAGKGRSKFEEFVALKDVTFDVREGEVFGVIGENGSGKSTLLKCMAGILQPNVGKVRVHKRMSALLELGAGFHPELSGRDNVFLNAAILGMSRKDISLRFDDIVEFSGLQSFIDSPVKTYSSGMYVRLAFAVAINVDPRLLIIDEILAVGDVSFQQRCLEKFVEFRNEGRTIVLVTHAMNTVRDMCDRAIWLTHGVITAAGDPAELVEEYTETMLGDGMRRSDGSIRRGSAEIQNTSIEVFVGDSATPVKRFRTGDDVRVRLHYRAVKSIPRPVFGIAIESVGGAVVTSPCTRDVGLVPTAVDGEGTVDIQLNSIALLPGTYDFNTSVTDFNRSHIYDHVQSHLRVDVMAGRRYETGGLVTVNPEWTID
ncbi:MAG: putative polysaccharide transporter ATP-binding protein [Ilumatobacteraceae bacterium]|nr:putative polysaccharide transporter ATP-binding protein [Ilumatobacteraceae bacterium]